ncbi:MAG: hypothetical protein MUF58_06035 [Arcicella sp.]|jgi:hypothetical protein|nr:hypothetical protein [Arcicella sp.]
MNIKFLVVLLLLGSACTKQPKLEGLDLEKWKKDKGGCNGERTQNIAKLKSLKEEIKGTSSNDLDDYLGRPDVQQLADRNQEYYVYFLESGPHCESVQKKSDAQTMIVRFSAMGMATEVTFQRGVPK